jgi:hypothetical protein
MRFLRYSRNLTGLSAALVLGLTLAGCASGVQNSAGIRARDIDPTVRGPVAGVGIEGQDINSMSDRMVRDMLQSPLLANAATPPQVVVDSQYFTNESSQQIDKNIIVDRLNNDLNNSAHGRMVFVSREAAAMVAQERDLKRQGVTDSGTVGLARAQAGVDYRLVGRITSADQIDRTTGQTQRLTQISFQMIDMERSTIVWSGLYSIDRAAADDVVYR